MMIMIMMMMMLLLMMMMVLMMLMVALMATMMITIAFSIVAMVAREPRARVAARRHALRNRAPKGHGAPAAGNYKIRGLKFNIDFLVMSLLEKTFFSLKGGVLPRRPSSNTYGAFCRGRR